MEIMIKQLTPSDLTNFKEMLQLLANAFKMQEFTLPADQYLHTLLAKPEFITFVAIHRGQIIGGVTAHVLSSYYYESAEVYIYDIAVKTEYQRRGFGKMLLEAVRSYSQQNKYNTVYVQANEDDQHALDFYSSTGGMAEKVVHFTYNIK